MNDQILSGHLEDFKDQQGLTELSEPDLFSQFVTYCVISKQTGNPASLDDLDVDGGQDTGIDVTPLELIQKCSNRKSRPVSKLLQERNICSKHIIKNHKLQRGGIFRS
jgi:hypothetical protein